MTTLVLALALPAVAVATEVACSVRRRSSRQRRAQCIEHIASLLMSREELDDEGVRQLRHRFSDREILDAVVFVASRICGARLYRLSFVVEVCESDYHLLRTLRRVWRRQQSSLPLYLALLSSLLTLLAGVWGSLRMVVALSALLLVVQFALVVARRANLEHRLFADLAATLKALPLFLHAHARRRGREKIFE